MLKRIGMAIAVALMVAVMSVSLVAADGGQDNGGGVDPNGMALWSG